MLFLLLFFCCCCFLLLLFWGVFSKEILVDCFLETKQLQLSLWFNCNLGKFCVIFRYMN